MEIRLCYVSSNKDTRLCTSMFDTLFYTVYNFHVSCLPASILQQWSVTNDHNIQNNHFILQYLFMFYTSIVCFVSKNKIVMSWIQHNHWIMGMVTLHIVIGVGVFILPLFLLLFTVVAMELAHVYIIIGSISFIASVLTSIVLVTKFINQPAAHGFFSYSDTFAR